jgi:hypothetical protein
MQRRWFPDLTHLIGARLHRHHARARRVRRSDTPAAAENERIRQDEARLDRILARWRLGAFELTGDFSDSGADYLLCIENWSPELAGTLERKAAPTMLAVTPLIDRSDDSKYVTACLHRWVDPVASAAGFWRSGTTVSAGPTVRALYEGDTAEFLRRNPDLAARQDIRGRGHLNSQS